MRRKMGNGRSEELKTIKEFNIGFLHRSGHDSTSDVAEDFLHSISCSVKVDRLAINIPPGTRQQ